jgi:MATE family multidrug resistance protein
VFSLGHVGTKELAASALSTMLCNVTGFSVGQGMASALDTLCSQSHTGSSDPHALGKHLQRSIVVMLFLSVPIAALWMFTERILVLAGQDVEISHLAGMYALYMIPGLFPYLASDCLRRYLQGQGIMKASMYITFTASILNVFLQWLLVWSPYSIGFIGAAVATSITDIVLPILHVLYICYFKGRKTWGGWDWSAALDIPQLYTFLSLGFPGVLMLCSEWWAFEVVALAAGLLGDKTLAAQTIALNTCSLFFMNQLGLSIAASVRLGNSLGSNLPHSSKRIASTALIMAIMLACFNSTFIFLIRNVWGYAFTSDEQVVHIVAQVLPLAALFQFNDCLGAVTGGILRGSGRQNVGAGINLAGYIM